MLVILFATWLNACLLFLLDVALVVLKTEINFVNDAMTAGD